MPKSIGMPRNQKDASNAEPEHSDDNSEEEEESEEEEQQAGALQAPRPQMSGKKRPRKPIADDYSEEENSDDEYDGRESGQEKEDGGEEEDEEDEEDEEGEEEGEEEDEEGGEDDAAPQADGVEFPANGGGVDGANAGSSQQLLAKIQEHVTTLADKTREIATLKEEKEKLSGEAKDLQKKVDRMTRTQAAQSREIDELRYKCGEGTAPRGSGPVREGADAAEGCDSPVSVPTQHALSRVRVPSEYQQHPDDFRLALLLPPDHESCELPRTYKNGAFHFPHRLVASKSGARQYILESRLLVHLACQLRNVPLNKNATEIDLTATREPASFKLEVCYADTGEVVQIEQLKTNPASLVEPPSALEPQRMTQGALKWKFHLKFLSRNTRPTGKEFIMRVSCTNPELAQYDLTADTPPFAIVSREVKRGGAAAAAP